jgi:hypothetical protein
LNQTWTTFYCGAAIQSNVENFLPAICNALPAGEIPAGPVVAAGFILDAIHRAGVNQTASGFMEATI